jgi:hypothetical protein
VDKKGFAGEEYTIAGDVLAYQDMGLAQQGLPDFKGVQRDGVPVGGPHFSHAYLDPEGRMTIMQWNTNPWRGLSHRAAGDQDRDLYLEIADNIPPGKVTFKAVLN